jgi:type IV pilus assembly protein PilB
LVGVVAQRLIRRVCQSCKTFTYASAELLETIHYDGDRRRCFVRGDGCPTSLEEVMRVAYFE